VDLFRFALDFFFVFAAGVVFAFGVALRAFALRPAFLGVPVKMLFSSSSSVIARSLVFFVAICPAPGLVRCNGAGRIKFQNVIVILQRTASRARGDNETRKHNRFDGTFSVAAG